MQDESHTSVSVLTDSGIFESWFYTEKKLIQVLGAESSEANFIRCIDTHVP